MSTGSGHFAILGSDFAQFFGQIISIRIKTLSNTNLAASRLIKREKTSLPVDVCRPKLGSLSNSVFERRTSTGSGLFVSLGSGLVETLGLIVFIREKKLSNTNLLASRHMKREKASLPVDVCRPNFAGAHYCAWSGEEFNPPQGISRFSGTKLTK